MKLSDYKDEEALDLLADILEPFSEIMGDPEIVKVLQGGGKQIEVVRLAVKNHKKEVMQVLARIEGVPLEEYHVNALTVPIKLVQLLNDKTLMEGF